MALLDAGVPFEVVPGVTSAFAAPAAAGVPVTHRGVSAAVTVVTGHRRRGEPDVDWRALARVGGTIVVLMGVTQRGQIAAELIAGGLAGDTPGRCRALGDDRRPGHAALPPRRARPSPPSSRRPCIVIGPVAAFELVGDVPTERAAVERDSSGLHGLTSRRRSRRARRPCRRGWRSPRRSTSPASATSTPPGWSPPAARWRTAAT